MKTIYNIIFLIFFSYSYAQNQRSLEDTKLYIVKMINENGWEENSNSRRLQAKFEGVLLRIVIMNSEFTKPINNGMVYNFGNVYKYKGPIKKPGDISRVIIWIDYLYNEKTLQWKKEAFEFDVHNHEAAEQLMIAFRHLNQLLIAKKPAVEKF